MMKNVIKYLPLDNFQITIQSPTWCMITITAF